MPSIVAAGGVATCNSGGAGKWRDEYACYFSGAEVIIVADKDEPGRARSHSLGRRAGVVGSVCVVEAKAGKDAADHLAGAYGRTSGSGLLMRLPRRARCPSTPLQNCRSWNIPRRGVHRRPRPFALGARHGRANSTPTRSTARRASTLDCYCGRSATACPSSMRPRRVKVALPDRGVARHLA